MGKGADAPNVMGAAQVTGDEARHLNAEQTAANRPNQYNPWGSTQWDQVAMENPVTGELESRWTQTESLAAPLQQALESQMNIGAGRAALAEGGMARVWQDYQNPMDFDQFGSPIELGQQSGPQAFNYSGPGVESFNYSGPGVEQFSADPNQFRQQAEDAAYLRQTNRLDPQFDSRETALRERLNNQGLRPGDQAYDSAMQNFNMSRNDAYEQARLASTAEGRSEAGQLFGQQLGSYQANLAGQDQGFGQALSGYGANLGAQNQLFGQQMSGAGLNADIQGQQFSQNVAQNQIANALRQQGISEAIGQRGYNLDEVERLLQGQMISGGPPSSGGATSTANNNNAGGFMSLLTGGA